MIGRVLSATVFGGRLFAETEKGLFAWFDTGWQRVEQAQAVQSTTEPKRTYLLSDGEPLTGAEHIERLRAGRHCDPSEDCDAQA